MGVRTDRRRVAFAAFLMSVAACPAVAQTPAAPAEAPIDPTAPLPPLEGLGIDWPEVTPSDGTAPAADASAEPEVRYTVVIEGLDDVGLDARFKALSSLEKSSTAENVAQLDRRAREDVATAQTLLRAGGWYASNVSTAIKAGDAPGDRTTVTLLAEPGPRYTFASVDVATPVGAPYELVRDTLRVRAKEPVDSAVLLSGEDRVRTQLPNKGYPFVTVGDRDLLIDHDTQTGEYKLPVDPGPRSVFGTIRVSDTRLMGPGHVASLARFKPGEIYDARDVEDLRRALVATGLFSSVALKPLRTDAEQAGDAVVDVDVTTQRAPPRTVAGQVGYSTGEGFRLEASWQHRALVRPEGALTVRGVLGTQEQRLAGELRFKNFRQRDNTLLLRSEASHEDRSAYSARSFTVAGAFSRDTNLIWQKVWTYSIGAELTLTDETDTDLKKNLSRRRTFGIAALPLTLGYDGSDDLLDPKRGFRLAGRLSPEASIQSGAFGYARTQIDASGYWPFSRDKFVLAGRVRLGTILGASRDRIAPSRRFYAGGGGSVRGFGYQDIGPKDAFNDPIGGRSLTEAAVELRARFGDFSVVPFLDGGQIYTKPLPSFDSLRLGAGVGVRYHTSFGPIRIDVGTPLNRQKGDSRIAVYVALGQAF